MTKSKAAIALSLASSLAVGAGLGFAAASKKVAAKAAPALPRLYIYDHCPFCVRTRMIFGLKGLPVELVFLANHDEATPIGLVGAKVVPILETPSGLVMPESMDIVRYVDATYGEKVILAEADATRADLKAWIKDSAECMRYLYHPRFHATLFAEFATQASRDYYKNKKEKTIGSFDDAITNSATYVAQLNAFLLQLEAMLKKPHSVNETLSYDDIDLFGRLRGLTIVQGVAWPPKVREYIEYMSKVSDIPLLDTLARF
ncbi:GrxB family glutaredoxin [Saprolegnia diclina VS20]|uniref:GrxB family glutaredoxin n=1 Tax=Saprolegnia diclina (strain VS20) TaxID=1156394 RepID=T0SAY6_SAPDV|nr:GrxB family glutaredoxin [Saprolegnia diclina VS20]EQC42513.1 GrxB family glutaredoxin [Saprolegnia diclina VS20]|eukprot:XP_008603936.1 GrxB family glutaredoxin [Saprolegnia diclina VS20]